MAERFCPCGTRLDRSSAVRSINSLLVRIFISIRSLKAVTIETKICNVCRHEYYKWKNENTELATMLMRLESEFVDVGDDDSHSVRILFMIIVLSLSSPIRLKP